MCRLGRRHFHLRHGCVVAMVAVVAVAGSVAPAARANDRETAVAVLTAQLELLKEQKALNKCLEASPDKNTPCITKKSLIIATLAARHIKLIRAAMDGSEAPCVRTVAKQELNFLQIWRDGALALNRNERKKAKRLFVQSIEISDAQRKLQPRCFAEVLSGP